MTEHDRMEHNIAHWLKRATPRQIATVLRALHFEMLVRNLPGFVPIAFASAAVDEHVAELSQTARDESPADEHPPVPGLPSES
jgi:hypothetical protein